MVSTFPAISATPAGAGHDLGLSTGLPDTVRAAFAPVADLAAALAYTRNLTTSHYENFSVISFLLPRHLRQDFCNVYAFCRIADDLGDEVRNPVLSLQYLADFRAQTQACYAGGGSGKATTAVFVALSETIRKYDIPVDPFLDLISAFEQDQSLTRYQTYDQIVDYCRRSANPVGRLVLYMTGYRDPQRQQLSDQICTALQLANFWQDVRRDLLERDRVYLPAEDLSRFGVSVEDLRAGHATPQYRDLLKFQVDRTQLLFDEGRGLLPLLHPRIRPQISLFSRGGQAILQAIRKQDYDTLTSRPKLTKGQKLTLMFRASLGVLLAPFGRVPSPGKGGAS